MNTSVFINSAPIHRVDDVYSAGTLAPVNYSKVLGLCSKEVLDLVYTLFETIDRPGQDLEFKDNSRQAILTRMQFKDNQRKLTFVLAADVTMKHSALGLWTMLTADPELFERCYEAACSANPQFDGRDKQHVLDEAGNPKPKEQTDPLV